MTLGIIIPIIEEELKKFFDNLELVKFNLKEAEIDSFKIVVIIQSKNNIDLPDIDKVLFIKTSFYSVSNARNIGLDTLKNECEYLYLLDQDAIPSVEFLNESKRNMNLKIDTWSGTINWINNINNLKYESKNVAKKLIPLFIPYRSFLGCYFFKAKLIDKFDIRFNLMLGPAENTFLKTGEDILFLCTLFSKNNLNFYKSYSSFYIHHPLRPVDNSKTLLYLEGQIAIYKYLIKNKDMLPQIRFGSLIYLFLFLINGFVKLIKGEKNGFKIFKYRFIYIFKKYEIHN